MHVVGFFEWTSDDFVFVPHLDADHQRLFEQLEKLREAVELHRAASELRFKLFRLQKSLSVHLLAEERLMKETRYPARQWHEQQHQAGRHKMARLLEASHGADAAPLCAAVEELATWMRDDVRLADRMLAAHLRNDRRERRAS